MSSRPPADHQAGFTLLELLVGMVLLGLALALVNQAAGLMNLEGARRDQRLARQQAVTQAREIMAGQVRSALPAPGQRTRQDPPVLTGDARQVSFLTSLSLQQPAAPGLWLVTYRLEPAAGGKGRLLLTQVPAGLSGAAPTGGQAGLSLTLLPGLTQGSFTYLALERPGRPLRTHANWGLGQPEQRTALPLAVLLQAKVGGQEVTWRLPLACAKPVSP
jgi:prepilin-type N-terminal cleavage/methylation domain-containing protein